VGSRVSDVGVRARPITPMWLSAHQYGRPADSSNGRKPHTERGATARVGAAIFGSTCLAQTRENGCSRPAKTISDQSCATTGMPPKLRSSLWSANA
jgi:hypothetical protein